MNPFIQFLIVFDLICFGVYFGGDIICTALAKVRKKTDEEEFELYKVEDDTDASKPALSIDAIRHLFRGEVHDFVCNKLLPSGQETLSALTEPEQTAARFLFCALIGYLKEEAPMDEQSFPMVMEMLIVIRVSLSSVEPLLSTQLLMAGLLRLKSQLNFNILTVRA